MSKITKLGLGIVAFEGTEHIKNITYEIRNYVDEIVVCLQRLSYHGDPIDVNDIKEVEKLKTVGLIDKIIWYEPDSDLNCLNAVKTHGRPEESARVIETFKRNFILDNLEADGCSHSMIIDSDEFYDGDEFRRAKAHIDMRDDIHVSYCQYINYWRDYSHYLVWPFKSFVPFISESKYRFAFRCNCFKFPVDPTRIYKLEPSEKYEIFKWDALKMHHLSWIRLDIRKKIFSWSSKKYFHKDLPDYVYKRYMGWKEYECAVILFNVPNNKVIVEKIKKQYIHPHYFLSDSVI